MSTLLLISEHGWQIAGWTMVYYLALGSLVAVVAAVVRFAMRSAPPVWRYGTSLAVFSLLALLPAGTAIWLLNTTPSALPHVMEPLATAPAAVDLALQPAPAPGAIPAVQSAETLSPLATNASNWSTELVIEHLPWLWLVGTPLTFLLLATGLVGAERLRRSSRVLNDGPLFQALEQLRKAAGLGCHVAVAICDRVASPLLVGIVRPLILLPPAALTGWSPADLEMVLLHELAHVRRWDNLVNLMQRIVESVLFFHPAVWLVSHWVRTDREDCCDAVVVARTAKPQAYAELLVSLASASQPLAGLALARHPLSSRIRHILHLPEEPMRVSRGTLVAAGTAMLALVLAVNSYNPQPSAAEENTPKAAAEKAVADKAEKQEQAAELEDKIVLQSADIVLLQVNNALPQAPLWGEFVIEPMGTIALGPSYGRVKIAGRELLEAERIVTDHLKMILEKPEVQLSLTNRSYDNVQQPIKGKFQPPAGPLTLHLFPASGTSGGVRTLARSDDLFAEKALIMRHLAEETAKIDRALQGLAKENEEAEAKFRNSKEPNAQAEWDKSRKTYELLVSRLQQEKIAIQNQQKRFVTDPDALQPGDRVVLRVKGALPDEPISDEYEIESMGTIALGPTYGRVKIAGQNLLKAEELIKVHLSEILENPLVQLTLRKRAPRDTFDQPLMPMAVPAVAPVGQPNVPMPIPAPAPGGAPLEGESPATPSAPAAASAPGALYDGKTFEEWRDLWKTELKTENRIECIKALAAFGRAGRGKEAAEAILDVAEQYDFGQGNLGTDEDKLKDRIWKSVGADFAGVNQKEWFALVLERAAKNRRSFQPLAAIFIRSVNASDEETRQKLLAIAAKGETPLGQSAIYALVASDYELSHPETIELVHRALQQDSPNMEVLNILRFSHLDLVPEQLGLLFHQDSHMRFQALSILSRTPNTAKDVVNHLVEILDDSAQESKHADAIRAIRVTPISLSQANKKRVVSRLYEIVREGDEQALVPALSTLNILLAQSTSLSIQDALNEGSVPNERRQLLQDADSLEIQISDEMNGDRSMGLGRGGFGGGGGGGGAF